jgi:putative transposase
LSVDQRRLLIDFGHEQIPVCRQCELLGLPRSSLYYHHDGSKAEHDRHLMRLIDEQYTRTPFYGIRRMTVWLRGQGHCVNHKRVSRLMRLMGIEAIYPKKRLSLSDSGHKKYPYLLKGLTIDRPDQVWATDITYIRMRHGFVYLVAILDWFSRYVVGWAVSITLDVEFCIEALHEALNLSKPEIFNSDQGSQFTSKNFTGVLEAHGVTISMDGKGRAFDNIFIERLWRSVKYEEVYLKEYESVRDAVRSLGTYFRFYNQDRPHQSLGYRTPLEVYTPKDSPSTVPDNILSRTRSTFPP